MASTAAQLAALGNDAQFQARVRSMVLQVAATVYAESAGTQDHAVRVAYAKRVIANTEEAQRLAVMIANTTNLIAGATTYDFTNGRVVTDVTDAAMLAQITSSWSMLAGV